MAQSNAPTLVRGRKGGYAPYKNEEGLAGPRFAVIPKAIWVPILILPVLSLRVLVPSAHAVTSTLVATPASLTVSSPVNGPDITKTINFTTSGTGGAVTITNVTDDSTASGTSEPGRRAQRLPL